MAIHSLCFMPVPESHVMLPLQALWRHCIRSISETTATNHNNSYGSRSFAEKNAVRAEIQSYEEDIASLQNLIELKRRTISPFRLYPLPSEILSRIFLECLYQAPPAPLTISHVCRLWREIAVRHRVLWSHIELTWEEKGIERAQTWLERSHPAPATLVVHGIDRWAGFQSLLLRTSARWKKITIYHRESSLEPFHPELWSFPSLKELRILDLECEDLDLESIDTILRRNTSLNSLGIAGSNFETDGPGWSLSKISDLKLSTNHLTHLSMGELLSIEREQPMPADVILTLLSACPNLESFECHHASEPLDASCAGILLPSLQKLSLGDGDRTCALLRYIDAPKLQCLRVFHPCVMSPPDQPVATGNATSRTSKQFTAFFKICLEDFRWACSPSLTKLVWDSTSLPWEALYASLETFRTIEEVEFRALDPIPASVLSDVLLESPRGGELRWLAPRLCTLTFISCRRVAFPRISRMLALRNGRRVDKLEESFRTPVERVNVHGCPDITNEAWHNICKLVSACT